MSLNNSFRLIGRVASSVAPCLRDWTLALLFLGIAADALCMGLARLNEARALAANDLNAANKAVSLAPSDPEAYRNRAVVLLKQARGDEAVRDAERAVQLNPRDYALWVDLANALQHRGDDAIDAYREATRLAPRYPDVRWSFGKYLLHTGRTTDAFAEFRQGSTNSPKLFLEAAELAWAASNGDAQFVVEAANPRTNKERCALSAFLLRHGKTQEATAILRGVQFLTEQDRLSLVIELITSERFNDAQIIWLSGRSNQVDGTIEGRITDGGFEHPVLVDDAGFGWQFQQHEKRVTATLDLQNPRAGTQSLRLDWKGESAPATPLVDQLVLVNPGSRYQLTFTARAGQLITGGLPFVEVRQATGNVTQSVQTGASLARSQTIAGSGGWQEYSVDFKTGNARAIYIVIRRESCTEQLCPIFGSAWFDDFNLTRLF